MVLLQVILVYRYINLRLEPLVKLILDKCLLIDFLLQRKDSKPVVIQVNSLSYRVFVFLVFKSMTVAINTCRDIQTVHCAHSIYMSHNKLQLFPRTVLTS